MCKTAQINWFPKFYTLCYSISFRKNERRKRMRKLISTVIIRRNNFFIPGRNKSVKVNNILLCG